MTTPNRGGRGGEPTPGAPGGSAAGPRSATAATFQVNDASLKQLRATFQGLAKDVRDFAKALDELKGRGDILDKVGGGSGTGGSGGGRLAGMPAAPPTPASRDLERYHPHAGPAAGTPLQPGVSFDQGGGRVSGMGWAVRGAGTALFAQGAFINRRMDDITGLDLLFNQQGQNQGGGYSGGDKRAARRDLFGGRGGQGPQGGITGYVSAQDAMAGLQVVFGATGGSTSNRGMQALRQAGNMAALNPDAGLAGSASAMANLYDPTVSARAMGMGFGATVGQRGQLQSPSAIYQRVIQQVFGGRRPTTNQIIEGMQPGAPLYLTLTRGLGLGPDAIQQFQRYAVAQANLNGNARDTERAIAASARMQSGGKVDDADRRLVQRAGLDDSIRSRQNALGASQTRQTVEAGRQVEGTLERGFDALASATDKLTGTFEQLNSISGGLLGATGGISALVGQPIGTAIGALGGLGGAMFTWQQGQQWWRNRGGRGRGGAGGGAGGGGGGAAGALGDLAGEALSGGVQKVFVVNMVPGFGGGGGGGGPTPAPVPGGGGGNPPGGGRGGRWGRLRSRLGGMRGAAGGVGLGAFGLAAGAGAGSHVYEGEDSPFRELTPEELAEFKERKKNGGWSEGGGGSWGRRASTDPAFHSLNAPRAGANPGFAYTADPNFSGQQGYYGYAKGGVIPGNHERDDVVIKTTPGEVVVPNYIVRRHGGAGRLMQKLGFRGGGGEGGHYAAGGEVTGDTQGLHPEFLKRLKAWSAAVGLPYNVGSGYRSLEEQKRLYDRWQRRVPGQAPAAKPGSSNHNFGLAADGPRWGNKNPEKFGLRYPMSYEPWHVEPVGAKQMRTGAVPANTSTDAPAAASGAPIPPSRNLVAVDAPSVGADEKSLLARILGSVGIDGATRYEASVKRASNPTATDAAGAAVPAEAGANAGVAVNKAPTNVNGNVSLGKQKAAGRGWTGGEWDALYALWQKESGWRHDAANPSSSARGIPQAMMSAHFGRNWQTDPKAQAWMADPAAQIDWGLNYIAGRYRTPSKAWAHHQKMNWYERGAWETDDEVARVHREEMVVPAPIARKLRKAVRDRGSQVQSGGAIPAQGSGGSQVIVQLTAPVTLAGRATREDATRFVSTVIDTLEENETLARLGSGS